MEVVYDLRISSGDYELSAAELEENIEKDGRPSVSNDRDTHLLKPSGLSLPR